MAQHPDFRVYTDGAARGNPKGMSASGYAVYDAQGNMVHKSVHINGIISNNMAEYRAIIFALGWCYQHAKEPAKTALELYSDSQLAISQLNGLYKVRQEHIKWLHQQVLTLAGFFKAVKFINVRRTDPYIRMVDRELNHKLDERQLHAKKNIK